MNRKLLEGIKYSPVSRLATLPLRARAAVPPVAKSGLHALRWIFRSREISEHGYDYDPLGILSLAAAASLMTGVSPETARGFAAELLADGDFVDRYVRRVRSTRLKYTLDRRVPFGKSLFFYVLVRSARPRLIFEAGTLNGSGSLAMSRALLRNAKEGSPGRILTVDSRLDRGELLEGDEGGLVTRLCGDSVELLLAMNNPIDFFIHDTTNLAAHTIAQFSALEQHLAPGAVVLTSWFGQEFADFCERNSLAYIEVSPRPADTWYTGSRHGLACDLAARSRQAAQGRLGTQE
jgi:hypothetical protein